MTHKQPHTVVMVAHLRYSGRHRLQQAYRHLWRWATAHEETGV